VSALDWVIVGLGAAALGTFTWSLATERIIFRRWLREDDETPL